MQILIHHLPSKIQRRARLQMPPVAKMFKRFPKLK